MADPFSRGHNYPKGNSILDLEADLDRLRQPRRRRGSDFEETSWDEAIAEAGERLANDRGAPVTGPRTSAGGFARWHQSRARPA